HSGYTDRKDFGDRVTPPVVPFGKIIVLPARAPRTRERGDCYRQFLDVSVRRAEDRRWHGPAARRERALSGIEQGSEWSGELPRASGRIPEAFLERTPGAGVVHVVKIFGSQQRLVQRRE